MHVVFGFFFKRFTKSILDLLVSPMSEWFILFGFALSGIIRGFIMGVLVLAVSLLFSPIHIHNIFVLVGFMILTSLVFSLIGFLVGLFAKDFDDISIIPTFVLTPLTYLGGVFYSINSLPPFWQSVSRFNPIFYMIDGFRYGALGVHDANLALGWTILVTLAVILFATNIILMKKGVGTKT